jgi:Transposase, Mutator family
MELELAEHLGAERHERTPERTGYRNGYRERPWDTHVGSIELQAPRVRDGSFFPSLLEPRRRAEKALVALVQEAYVHGISTRRVDDLVHALGMQGIRRAGSAGCAPNWTKRSRASARARSRDRTHTSGWTAPSSTYVTTGGWSRRQSPSP